MDDIAKLKRQIFELQGTVASLVNTVNVLARDQPGLRIKPTKLP